MHTSKMIYFGLDEAQSGRYVGFRVTQGANGNFVSGSELDLFAEKFTSVPKGEGSGFAASKLKLKDVAISDTTDKPGKMIAFTFDAAQFAPPTAPWWRRSSCTTATTSCASSSRSSLRTRALVLTSLTASTSHGGW